jgi:uncharacterized protein (TIGR02466 family)
MKSGGPESVQHLFVTSLYSAHLPLRLARGLEAASLTIARDDRAGRRWSKAHGYKGYTSYASLDDLTWRAPEFAALQAELDRHAAIFARELEFELGRRKLKMDSIWVNVMSRGAIHTPHIHPHSAISGTFYVTAPKGSGAITFEDPRLPMLMAAPPRRKTARLQNRSFVTLAPKAGTLLMWESWLRHGVEVNRADSPRISVSFNYRLD